jgi:thymidine phosphorylase
MGDFARKGETIAVVHANDRQKLSQVLPDILSSIQMAEKPVARPKLIHALVSKDGVESF